MLVRTINVYSLKGEASGVLDLLYRPLLAILSLAKDLSPEWLISVWNNPTLSPSGPQPTVPQINMVTPGYAREQYTRSETLAND